MYCKTKDIFFIFLCLLFMYYFCEKYYKPITVQYLEKYNSTEQWLAYRGWHQVNRQEELLTGGGRGCGGQ